MSFVLYYRPCFVFGTGQDAGSQCRHPDWTGNSPCSFISSSVRISEEKSEHNGVVVAKGGVADGRATCGRQRGEETFVGPLEVRTAPTANSTSRSSQLLCWTSGQPGLTNLRGGRSGGHTPSRGAWASVLYSIVLPSSCLEESGRSRQIYGAWAFATLCCRTEHGWHHGNRRRNAFCSSFSKCSASRPSPNGDTRESIWPRLAFGPPHRAGNEESEATSTFGVLRFKLIRSDLEFHPAAWGQPRRE